MIYRLRRKFILISAVSTILVFKDIANASLAEAFNLEALLILICDKDTYKANKNVIQQTNVEITFLLAI